MYTSSYHSYNYGQNPTFTSFTSNYHINQYYKSKIYDDHRFERRKLQKPAFLIKQQAIYPQSSSYSIANVLEYADTLARPSNNKFYSQAAQQERVRTQGKNPFINQSYQQSLFDLSQSNRVKKNSRSRIGTNQNLGVTSYQVLQENNVQETYVGNKKQREIEISAIKKPSMQDYISESILRNFVGRNNQNNQKYKMGSFQRFQQDKQAIKVSKSQRRQVLNSIRSSKKNSQPTIVKPRKIPQQLVYKGKRFLILN